MAYAFYVVDLLLLRVLRAIWLAGSGHHDDLSNNLRMTRRNRSKRLASSFGQTSWHLSSSSFRCSVCRILTRLAWGTGRKREQTQCAGACPQKHMPDSSASEHALLVACALAVKTAKLKTGGPSPTRDLPRPLPKAASLAVKKAPRSIR